MPLGSTSNGFGTAPMGVAPYGTGTPISGSDNAGKPLSDSTGKQFGGRYIDPSTRDFVFDSNGRLTGMPNVTQLVLLAIGGIKFDILNIGSDTAQIMSDKLTTALNPIVTKNLLKIQKIDVMIQGSKIKTTLAWKDLTTGNDRVTKF